MPRTPWVALIGLVAGAALLAPVGRAAVQDDDDVSLGPPPLYDTLREAEVEPAGQIRDGRLRVDRFEFEFTDGDLYLLAPVEGRVTAAVFLGDGLVRAYPPDGVEHHQVERFLDEDVVEERFDRMVWRFTGDIADRLRTLAADTPGRETGKAQDLLEDRRKAIFEQRLANLDARVLLDLLDPPAPGAERAFFQAEIDTKDEGWVTVSVEPRDLEEVRIYRFDHHRTIANVWIGTHALTDYDGDAAARAFAGFPRDPDTEGPLDETDDDDDWSARDLGLSPRSIRPDAEGWSPRVNVLRSDVDLALESNGDAKGSVALVIEPLEPLSAFRLSISPFLEVTDVRWRQDLPDDVENVRAVPLLTWPPDDTAQDLPERPRPPQMDEPLPLGGEPVYYVQEKHGRWSQDDRYDPSLVVALPRRMDAGERFIVEIAYEGELVERLPQSQSLLLKDTISWIPRHMDDRGSRMSLTFRVPDRYGVASGGVLVDEQVEDGTQVTRWVSDEPVRVMSFNFGRFDVNEVAIDDMPPIALYENEDMLGFAPGNREKTIQDLTGAIRTYTDYFGPYPYDSLLVTETPTLSGQAFPGLVLLSFAAFGQLHTGEAEVFRAHEVAHQWWGAAVDWEGYRDQWISEGFAQYAAALFTLDGLEEEEQFLRMLDAWQRDVRSEPSVGQGLGLHRYGFLPAVIQRSDGNQSGPVTAGYRLRSSDTPMDYRLLVYEKGAFILHMLRMMLMDLDAGTDERFRALMRGFVTDHLHGIATTHAFETAVNDAFGEPMDWFFDQWVYGVEVPTYRPDLEVTAVVDAELPFVLHGTIRQEDVPDGFRMPVPVRLRFDDRPPLHYRIWVDAPEVDVELPIPAQPDEVDFNYHHGVLAHVR